MLTKLKIVGEHIAKNGGTLNNLQLNTNLQAANIIILDFALNENECAFIKTDIMQFDQSKNSKILLKSVPGQKKSEFPSYQIMSHPNAEQQKDNIRKSMKKMTVTLENAAEINPSLQNLVEVFNEKRGELEELISPLIDSKTSNIVTIRINGLLTGESPYFKPVIDRFLSEQDKDYYFKYGIESKGKNNVCYICGKNVNITYGFCSTYNFYSSNEFAYIAGGFRQEDSWKNYPVCPTCASYLRIGKEWIGQNFNRYFYGCNYLLFPAPTLERGDFYSLLKDIAQEFTEISFKQSHERNIQRRLEMEEDVFDTLSEQKDQVTFTFLFYEENNSEFKILQEAEDILPSRFKTIINAKKIIENHSDFKNLKNLYHKNENADLHFNFGIIKDFFSSNYNTDFLDITTKILKNRPIDRQFILHQISNMISEKFRNEELFHVIPKAMIFMKFLYALNLIKNEKNKLEVQMDNKYENYFMEHPDFYDADWKKAVFLLGILAQNILDIQWQERDATPFRNRLNGLKIDYRIVKRLLPECINKLEQYKKNYYRELEEVIAALLESGEPDLRMQSVDEISFYFAMGMNRNKNFKLKDVNEGEENE